MSFHHPALLWLLALPLLWGFWQWVRRGHAVAMPFDHGVRREGRAARFLIHLAGTLPALLLAVAVLMLAGPRRAAPPTDERVLNNILLCIDVSGSMNAPFGQGENRFEAAVRSAREFCDHREGDAFGLTIFGTEYIHWVPPTRDLSAVSNAMNHVRPRNMPPWMGGTMIGNALRGCRDQLVRIGEGDRMIVLISDGSSSDFQNGGDRAVAEELARDGIRVFGILIGADLDSGGMETVSAITGGRTFQAGDASALDEIFREIDRMQMARFVPSTADWVDHHRPFTLAGASALALYSLTLLGLRYTPW